MSWRSLMLKGQSKHGSLVQSGQGSGVSLGKGGRGEETADAVLLLYLPRREAAAGSDPEALHSASAEEPTRTWDPPNACVIGLLLFPAPAHQTGRDVTRFSRVVGDGNVLRLLCWPRLESQPIGLSSLPGSRSPLPTAPLNPAPLPTDGNCSPTRAGK